MTKNSTLFYFAFCILHFAFPVLAADAPAGPAKPLVTGLRSTHIHRLGLWDENQKLIEPQFTGKADPTAPVFSMVNTCGKCHPGGTISHGWHFNAADPDVKPGRPGEPWIVVDKETQTQIPVSSRGWPGTYKPQDIGLTSWEFVRRFGGHMPGGGVGSTYSDADPKLIDPKARWQFSGKLDIDCMMCHEAAHGHDQTEWMLALLNDNFKWAPMIALGLGRVEGMAKALKDAPVVDSADPAASEGTGAAPSLPLEYDKRKFDRDNRVFFDIVRTPSADRCYFCHSVRQVGPGAPTKHEVDGDVHVRAGMQCATCHRNGIDHNTVRGYEGETGIEHLPGAAALTCAGCHLGQGATEPTGAPTAGRLGAPHPEHKGLPPIHLQKLTCTACHSGPWPEQQAQAVQTSFAHNFGAQALWRSRTDADVPHIAEPIFLRETAQEAKIAPHRIVWPSFWAWRQNGKLTPILPVEMSSVVKHARAKKPPTTSDAPKDPNAAKGLQELRVDQIAAALDEMKTNKPEGDPVYVRNGRVYEKSGESKPYQQEPVAAPYAWPIAHDVRPASQALGVRGCTDCHAANAPFNSGSVLTSFDVSADAPPLIPAGNMAQLRGKTLAMDEMWAWSFAKRSTFKIFAFSACGLLGLALLRYTLMGIGGFIKRLGGG